MAIQSEHSDKLIRALLIEDDPDDVDLLRRSVSMNDFEIQFDVVDNGEDALQYLTQGAGSLKKQLPDIVFLDLNLPRLNGKKVLRSIRKRFDSSELIVIIFTTSSAQEDMEQCYELDANCFISKPVTLEGYVDVMKGIHGFWLNTSSLGSC